MSRVTLLVVAGLLIVCASNSVIAQTKKEVEVVKALAPPEVKKGEPVAFKNADYSVRDWKSKSKASATSAFKVNGDSWYVDWDEERRLFDTIMIHHSATSAKATPAQIDEYGMDGYVNRYNINFNEPFVKGLLIHSGHVIDGKERFIDYHHLIYVDGKVTTELSSLVKVGERWFVDHIAWHAGKNKNSKGENGWDLNCHSIAICLIGDFSKWKTLEPSEAQLKATAGLIVHYKEFNPKLKVMGHKDHAATKCPGTLWLEWWGQKLFALAGIEQ